LEVIILRLLAPSPVLRRCTPRPNYSGLTRISTPTPQNLHQVRMYMACLWHTYRAWSHTTPNGNALTFKRTSATSALDRMSPRSTNLLKTRASSSLRQKNVSRKTLVLSRKSSQNILKNGIINTGFRLTSTRSTPKVLVRRVLPKRMV
jgi:hypothetical protein